MATKDLPALLTAVKNQQASLFLQFGGQASVWLTELETVFKASSSAKTLVTLCAGVITEELQHLHRNFPALERHYHLGFDILKWLTHREPLPATYRQSAPISYPMILLTQLANWAEALEKLKLSPRELCTFFQGATGHSQGVVAAVVVASSTTLADFLKRSQDAIRYMFWHGVRVQEASGNVTPESDQAQSPMLLVKAAASDIEPIINQLNAQLDPSQRAYISLRNSSSMTVVSGAIPTLARFKSSSTQFECTFLPVTCPFHCPLLASAIPTIMSDLNRLRVFLASDLLIPVYDPADGRDLRTLTGSLNECLVRGQTVRSVDWPAAIAVAQKGITHILDVGPGQKIMRLSGGITNGNAVMLSVKDPVFYEKNGQIPHMTRLASDSKDPDLLEQLRYAGYEAPAVSSDTDGSAKKAETNEASVVMHMSPARIPEQTKHTISFKLQSPEQTAFVFSHAIRGNLVIPMTVAVGKMASVTLEHYPGWYLSGIQDAVLFSGLQHRVGLNCEINLTRDGQQEDNKLSVVANFRTEAASGKWTPCYKAVIKLTNTPPANGPTIAVNLKEGKTISQAAMYDGRTLFHGPLLKGIQKVLNVTDSSLVAICKQIPLTPMESGQFAGGFDSFTLDIALQAALVWARANFDQASLPNKMTKLEFYSDIPPNSTYYLTMSAIAGSGPVRFLDCDFHDENGKVYLRANGLSITMNPTLSFQQPTQVPTPVSKSAPAIQPQASNTVGAQPSKPQLETKTQQPQPSVKRPHSNDPRIAVVGMAVKYAGAPNTKQFWDLLVANQDNIVSVPSSRLGTKNKELHLTTERSKYADSIASDKYGVLDEEAKDEHSFLLLLAQRALEDTRGKRSLDRCGVVSGCLSFPRDTVQQELMPIYREHVERELTKNGEPDLATARNWGLDDPAPKRTEDSDKQATLDPATYVAQKLGLKGGAPTYVLDAACASALYALKLAQDHLVQGDADIMLCGASTFPEPFFILTGFSAFQALPLPGQFAAPFQVGTSGLTPGEGGAMMVLKRLEDAVRDGDRIYGTLLGVATTNAGRGLPLKPDSASELECLQAAYTSLGVEPSSIQYVECHATGTAQGDECEISAVRTCFKPHMPLIGSTKGTFGHSLVAAGFAGMCKLLLAMQNNLIPATHSHGSLSNPVCSEVVMKNQPWPKTSPGQVRRGALSAFGFGGTNAHAIFEEFSPERLAPSQCGKDFSPCKLAIVGMAARFGTLMDLNDVERAVYDGTNAACVLPEKRWRFLSDDQHFLAKLRKGNLNRVHGCFIDSIEVDYKALKLSLLTEDELLPQQLVALSTIDAALKDCRGAINRNSKVAVLVGLGADMELYRHRARLAMRERLGLGSTETRTPSQEALLDYMADAGTSTSYTSNIGNIIATRIASMWGFTGPSFTVTEGANSVFRCVQLGRAMLSTGEVEAVVVAGVDLCGSAEALYAKVSHGQTMSSKEFPTASFDSEHDGFFVGEGAGVLILKRLQDCESKTPSDVRVYAVLEDVAEAESVAASAAQALAGAKVDPQQVDMLEVSGDSDLADGMELPALAGVYRADHRAVSVGTVKANLGHCGYASGAAALIKAALCLHNQYLPSLPNWTGPKQNALWEESSFYVCGDSRAWVKNQGVKRFAAVSGVTATSVSCFHMVLSDLHHETQNRIALAPLAPKLVLLRSSTPSGLIGEIEASLARAQKDSTKEMVSLLRDTLEEKSAKLILSLVSTVAGLPSELQKALAGVGRSIQSGVDWTSPSGSFFTPRPLNSGQVSFVYGDGASPYVGLGQQLHRIYPALHEVIHAKTTDMWSVSDEAWNCREITKAAMDLKRVEFAVRQIDMFRSGVFHAVCFTSLVRELLGLKPRAAFGLSMGEVSMLFAFSEHNSKQSDVMMSRLGNSAVWNMELAANFNALRKAWNIGADAPTSTFWQGYVIHASRAEVEAVLPSFKHVRLIIVNDNRTCVIAGVREECQALITRLGAQSSPLQQGMIAHTPEVKPFVKDIAQIHDMLQTPAEHGVDLFTSVGYKPLTSASGHIEDVISAIYSEIADFPKIATAVYQAGYNVFVELGANDARTQALKMIFAGQPHVAVAIDRKGHQTWKQLLKMLAILLSHNTPSISLAKLYHPILLTEEGHPPNPQAPVITRGKDPQTPRRANSNNSQKILRMVPINGRFAGLRYPPTPYVAPEEKKAKSVTISTASSLQDITAALLAFDTNIKVTPSREVFACTPLDLGDSTFCECYDTDYPLYVGAMAKGISSVDLVIACGQRRMLASLGAGGLTISALEDALSKVQKALPNGPYAVNLVYNPHSQSEEATLVDLFLARGVRVLEVSNYSAITLQLVRYRVLGLARSASGVTCRNKIIFKTPRADLAELAMQPLPSDLVTKLVQEGLITKELAAMAQRVTLADDITIESDSGGHTENRPYVVTLPIVVHARDRLRSQFGLPFRVRVGVAGGIGCPEAASAAFASGAAFVCTGTINQMSKQAGVCDDVRLALSRATYTDVGTCFADTMSSMKLQVLKKGTMFIARARKLHDLSVRYNSVDEIPAAELAKIEKDLFKQSINQVWEETKAHYTQRLRNPTRLAEAERNPRVKFELIYHWYLTKAFGWTLQGDARRKLDYHVWCSPAIGSFNSFIKDSFLDPAGGGGYPCVFQLNLHLLLGACYLMRLRLLGNAGLSVSEVAPYKPTDQL